MASWAAAPLGMWRACGPRQSPTVMRTLRSAEAWEDGSEVRIGKQAAKAKRDKVLVFECFVVLV